MYSALQLERCTLDTYTHTTSIVHVLLYTHAHTHPVGLYIRFEELRSSGNILEVNETGCLVGIECCLGSVPGAHSALQQKSWMEVCMGARLSGAWALVNTTECCSEWDVMLHSSY